MNDLNLNKMVEAPMDGTYILLVKYSQFNTIPYQVEIGCLETGVTRTPYWRTYQGVKFAPITDILGWLPWSEESVRQLVHENVMPLTKSLPEQTMTDMEYGLYKLSKSILAMMNEVKKSVQKSMLTKNLISSDYLMIEELVNKQLKDIQHSKEYNERRKG